MNYSGAAISSAHLGHCTKQILLLPITMWQKHMTDP
jgi:hypothetical protein